MSPPEHVQIKLYTSVSTAAASQPFTLIIQQLIEPGWHTYWKNPGDSGTALTADITLPDGGTAGDLMFPTPTRLPFGPLMNFGYTGTALFAVTITPPAKIEGETYTLTANLNWLACHEVCVPESGSYSVVLPVTGTPAAANESISDIMHDLTTTHPMRADIPVTYVEKEGQLVMTVPLMPSARAVVSQGGALTFFPEEWGLINNAAPQKVEVLDQAMPLRLTIPRGDRPLSEVPSTRGVLVATDASGHAQGYDILAYPEGAARPSAASSLSSFEIQPEEGSTSATQGDPKSPPDDSNGFAFLIALVFAFLGGLALNLMPCVFPVLALKILALSNLPAKEQQAARLHGIAYGTGVVASFCSIGLVLALLQGLGFASGWGFQLQDPLTVTILFYLFILIGLNLMGVYEIDLNRFVPARLHGNHEGLTGSFLTGILATIIATPCTAPFMGAAMAYALTHTTMVGVFIFAVMGVGLALPFVILTFSPRLMKSLPRPGAWMATLRHGLAFPMYLAAIWLLWVLAHQTGADGSAAALTAALAIAALFWLLDHAPRSRRMRALRLVSIAALCAAIVALTSVQTARPTATMDAQGTLAERPPPFTPALLEQALATDRPVFVNMTAAWCITCKVNEQLALSAPSVQGTLRARDILTVTGDWTLYNPDITAYLAQFGRSGVPLYVYYPAPDAAAGGTRPAPIVLPQILTPAILQGVFTHERNEK